MSKSYVIRWRSKENGRVGRGSRLFEKEEAAELAAELNSEYPEIEHEVVDIRNEPASPVAEQTGELSARQPEHALTE